MDGPVITIAGQQLKFGTDGSVTDNAAGTALGTWTSTSDTQDNLIRYTVGGADQAPLKATYSFTPDPNVNMLQMQLATGDGAAVSDPFSFAGGIEVDDQHNLSYFLVDTTGARTGVSITLYGDISFAQDSNNLSVALTGGGTVEVAGRNGTQSLNAVENDLADFKGDDLLKFSAETDNAIAGSEDPLVVPAVILFTGNWDIRNGSLVFMSNIKAAPGENQVHIAFAGKLKGVTVGFAYFADAAGTSLAFNVTGQHVFKAETVTWASSIGFTGKTFDATVDIAVSHPTGTRGLSLAGHLNLKDSGGDSRLELSLEAEYDFDEHNILVFKATVEEGGPTPSYDLMLSGTFHYSSLNLTFKIEYTDKAGAQDLTVAVGIQGDRDSIVKNLALILNVSQGEASVQLTLSFSVRLQFVDGVRINGPKTLAAGG